jgi:hypothetical protein
MYLPPFLDVDVKIVALLIIEEIGAELVTRQGSFSLLFPLEGEFLKNQEIAKINEYLQKRAQALAGLCSFVQRRKSLLL